MKKYFTLIELLVVVAVIGILVSILLPSLVKGEAKGLRGSLCQQYETSFNWPEYIPKEQQLPLSSWRQTE